MPGKFLSCRASESLVNTMSLRDYFSDEKEKNVLISGRLKNETGEAFMFTVKGIKEREIENINAFSEKDFVCEVIKKGCINPKFNESKEIEQGFLPGEAYRLYSEIIKAGNLDKSFSELKKQVGAMLLKGEAEAVYACISAFEIGLLPREFTELDRMEKACIGAFIDEKMRIRKKKGR